MKYKSAFTLTEIIGAIRLGCKHFNVPIPTQGLDLVTLNCTTITYLYILTLLIWQEQCKYLTETQEKYT